MSEIHYTTEMVDELRRCMTDPNYFIREHVGIRLTTQQKEMLKAFRSGKNCVAFAERQKGKTTVQLLYALWFALFHNDKTILWGSVNFNLALDANARFREFYDRVPVWMKPATRFCNKTSVEFNNGARIHFGTVTENFGRGFSISLLVLDEFAFVRRAVDEEYMMAIMPCIYHTGRLISCSTGRVGSMFNKLHSSQNFVSLDFGGRHGE